MARNKSNRPPAAPRPAPAGPSSAQAAGLAPLAPTTPATNEHIKHQIANRFWRGLNYLSINLFFLLVYGSTLLAEYAIAQIVWLVLAGEIQQYPAVAFAARVAQIALALMTLVAAVVHGGYSMWAQIQLDRAEANGDGI